jgi:hypothetical protein
MHAQQKAAQIAKALAPASKLAHGFAPEIVAEGQAILNYDTKKMGPNTALSLFQALLRRLKIPYMAKLCPRQMLTHPGNRGGLMVSGHEVHKKGGKMFGQGMKTPVGGLAIEIVPVEGDVLRAYHFKANRDLVERSDGLIAPVSGEERFSAMATNHCAQFGKAIEAKCKTPLNALQDKNGDLNKHSLGERDPNIYTFVDEGWEYEVYPWTVEVAWPEFPELAQMAANSENAVSEGLGETETVMHVLKLHARGTPLDVALASAASVAHHPESMPAIKALCEFFKEADAKKALTKVDNFRSSLGLTLKLGNEFCHAVGCTPVPKGWLTGCALVRTALIATQSTATNEMDGVAKFLTANHVKKLIGNGQLCTTLEGIFGALDEWCVELEAAAAADATSLNNVLHRCMVRGVLFACDLEEKGFEQKTFGSLVAIQSAAATELQACLKRGKKNPCTWHRYEQPCPPKAAGAATAKAQPSLGDMSDVACVMASRGFKPNVLVYDRTLGNGAVFKITRVDASGVTLEKRTLGISPPFTTTPSCEKFVGQYSIVKNVAQLANVIPVPSGSDVLMVKRHTFHAIETAKQRLYGAIMDVDTDAASKWGNDAFIYMTKPKKLLAAITFKKGEMMLIPRAEYGAYTALDSGKDAEKNCEVHGVVGVPAGIVQIRISVPSGSTDLENLDSVIRKGGPQGKFEPYAWVGTTSDKKLANMQLEIHRDIHNNLSYPYYTNTKDVPKFTELRSYKAAAAKVATDAESVAKAEAIAAKDAAKRQAAPQESAEKRRRGDKHAGNVD